MRTVALSLTAASVLLLAGCAGLFPPDPTAAPTSGAPTSAAPHTFASATCAPDTAAFEWSAAPSAGRDFVSVSTRYQAYDKKRTGGSTEWPDGQISITSWDGGTVFDTMLADEQHWDPALLSSLMATNIVPADFAKVDQVADNTDFTPPEPHRGSWVRAVVSPYISVRVTVTCADGSTGSGVVSAPAPTRTTEITVHCDGTMRVNAATEKEAALAACSNF